MEKFTSVAGVHQALRDTARKGKCTGCGGRTWIYAWPLPGLGEYCAPCIVVRTGGGPGA